MLLDDVGLKVAPGSALWWSIRPAWLGVYLLALLPFALAFGRFERSGAAEQIYPAWRLIVAALLICAGLALMALDGVAGEGWFGLRVGPVLLPFAGALLAGVNPLRK